MLPRVINADIDLAAAESPRRRATALFGAMLTGFAGLFFVAAPITFSLQEQAWAESVRARFGPEHGPTSDGLPWFMLVVFPAIGLLMMGFSLVGILRVFRAAAWLTGTVAHVRGTFRTRSMDLSRAYISVGSRTRQEHVASTHHGSTTVNHIAVWEVPTLEAQEPATGRKLTIELMRPGGGALPPYALRALAEAMVHGRGWDGNDRDVHQLAQRLRIMADKAGFAPDRSTAEPSGRHPLTEPPTASDPWLANAPGYGDAGQASLPVPSDAWRSDGPAPDPIPWPGPPAGISSTTSPFRPGRRCW
jgi:hypothetical protein